MWVWYKSLLSECLTFIPMELVLGHTSLGRYEKYSLDALVFYQIYAKRIAMKPFLT